VIFHCEILITIRFNEYIQAYELRFSGTKTNVNIEDLSDPLSISINKNIRNEKYVILRYLILVILYLSYVLDTMYFLNSNKNKNMYFSEFVILTNLNC